MKTVSTLCVITSAFCGPLVYVKPHYSSFMILEPPRDKTNKVAYAPSEGSDQPGRPPRLIRVFAVCVKKAWVLSYPLSAQRRLWSDWADVQADPSLRWAPSYSQLVLSRGGSVITIVFLDVQFLGFLRYSPCKPTFSISKGFRGMSQSIWASSWDYGTFRPPQTHKVILYTRMRSHPMGLHVWPLVGLFVYFLSSCVRTAKALVRLRGCAGSPEPSLLAYVISTITHELAHIQSSTSMTLFLVSRTLLNSDTHPFKTEVNPYLPGGLCHPYI